MTDGLRKSHLRKAPQVGLSEVGLPDIYRKIPNLRRLEEVEQLPRGSLIKLEETIFRYAVTCS